ncbi:MAG: WbqC family protein [Rickettsiales bacterium]|nr:WbqC family protein [Rickettsiales bacterium]
MKKVAIIQSNYIPWKGYFHMIDKVDHFILLDDVQYTKRDWRNRNRIKTKQGLQWLTIPVQTKGKYNQSIMDTKVSGHQWADKHWAHIMHTYQHASFFAEYHQTIKQLYDQVKHEDSLSRINYSFIQALCVLFGITTSISYSTDIMPLEALASYDKNERLIAICNAVDASHYLSGPAAKTYMDEERFKQEGIEVEFMNYPNYPDYPHLYGKCDHYVSIIDLLFHAGNDASLFYGVTS